MKFDRIGQYDHIEDVTVFWVEISDLPQDIQDEAKLIDGKAYDPECFGMCIYYNWTREKFVIATDADTGNVRNIFYVDDNGDNHWFKAEIPQEFADEVFAACNKINVETVHSKAAPKRIAEQLAEATKQAAKHNAARPASSKDTDRDR